MPRSAKARTDEVKGFENDRFQREILVLSRQRRSRNPAADDGRGRKLEVAARRERTAKEMKSGKGWDISRLKEWVLSKNGSRILVIVGIVGIGLIFLSEFIPSSGTSAAGTASALTSDEYSQKVQTQLQSIIGQIDGVGHVNVMVTVESGVEYVYEQSVKTTSDKSQDSESSGRQQTQENSNEEKSAILIDQGSGGQQALVKTEIQPKIQGVVVVCDGGNDPVVKEKVIDAVTVALNISSTQISVSKKIEP